MGLKEFCALLLAGGIGAGSVVTVQAVKAPAAREARATKPKPRPAAARPKPKLPDCPVVVAPLGTGLFPELAEAGPVARPMAAPLPRPGALPSVGEAGTDWPLLVAPTTVRPPPSLPAPGTVPDAATWAMMVAGFGLIGLALRRREHASA
ncbi:PEPxxWA-CTERM sorting domain-containing protein [Thermaurantiacus sp.]